MSFLLDSARRTVVLLMLVQAKGLAEAKPLCNNRPCEMLPAVHKRYQGTSLVHVEAMERLTTNSYG